MEEEQQRFMQRFKDWYFEHDLHLWLGAITVIAGAILLYFLHQESEKTQKLLSEIQSLNTQMLYKDNEISSLRTELSTIKQKAVVPPSKVEQRLETVTDKVKTKLEKVQDNQIKPPTKEIKTIKEYTVVEKNIKLDRELEQSMLDSFCSANPQDNKCKKGAR